MHCEGIEIKYTISADKHMEMADTCCMRHDVLAEGCKAILFTHGGQVGYVKWEALL